MRPHLEVGLADLTPWIAGLAGAVVGGLASWALLPSPPPGAPTADATPCPDAVQVEIAEMLRLRDEQSAAERAVTRARFRRAFRLARARSFPEGHHPALAPAALEAHLAEALASQEPAELLEFDCSAFPCVATLSWEHQPEDEGLLDDGEGRANFPGRLLAAVQGDGEYASLPIHFTGRLDPDGGGASVFSFAFLDPADFDAAKRAPRDQALVDGTQVDQARGRVEDRADHWAEERAAAAAPEADAPSEAP
jgi:hypothetical protein